MSPPSGGAPGREPGRWARLARRLSAPAVGGLLGLALLVPSADRATLIAKGVGRLLQADLEAGFDRGEGAARSGAARATSPGPERASIFRALHRVSIDDSRATVAARVRLDGEPVASPAFARSLASTLNLYNASHRAGRPRLRLVPAGEPAGVALDLDVRVRGERVSLAARVAGGGEVLQVSPPASWPIPGRSALLPPLLAIAVALALKRTLFALFVGIYAGAALLAVEASGGDVAAGLARGLWDVFAVYLRRELFDTFRIEILGFVVMLVAAVGVMSRAGGVRGVIDRLLRFARTARSGLLLTWGMGLLLFFDDYANCVLVGNTMRPLTDRLRISREKLAYVVDSTAAPVAGISLISTWIAFEVSVFSAQLPGVGITESGYALFLRSLPFRYYCFFALGFVLLTILTGRDFGPMARAEERARRTGQLVRPGARPPVSDTLARMEPAPGMPLDWRVAVLPIAATLAVTVWRIFADGGGLELLRTDASSLLTLEGITGVLLEGSGARPIFIGAAVALLLSVFLAGSATTRWAVSAGTVAALAFAGAVEPTFARALGSNLAGYASFALLFTTVAGVAALAASRLATRRPYLPWRELGRAGVSGAGTLGFAVVLLLEAWMIGRVCEDIGTADYLVGLLSDALPAELLPALLFGLACLVAFATGSSWSTMSILLPNVVALAASLSSAAGTGASLMVPLCIAAVLEGSIFGDHCSPISDTTVLSSVASGSDHLDHVRSQAPYALAAAAAAVVFGYLPAARLAWWSFPLAMALGFGALWGALRLFGRTPEGAPTRG